MTLAGWAEIALVLALVAGTAPLLAGYMAKVFGAERTLLSPVLGPVERGFYAAAGVDPARGQDWRRYLLAVLAFNAAGLVLLYGILQLQHLLPLNPAGMPALSDHLAFNTAVSFVTNTNWQSYGGETTMSHFSQMAGLTVQNFVSAATGMAVELAVVGAFASKGAADLGDFWADLTRAVLYVLLPICVVLAVVYVALGVPQTLEGRPR